MMPLLLISILALVLGVAVAASAVVKVSQLLHAVAAAAIIANFIDAFRTSPVGAFFQQQKQK